MSTIEKLSMAAAAFMFGWFADEHFSRPERIAASPTPASQVWFQKNDCTFKEGRLQDDECRFEITPKTMTLSFVTQDYFDSQVKNASGFARISRNPCEIVIPAGAIITSIPRHARALWSYRMGHYIDIEQTLVHEILHCYIGRWHPESFELALNDLRDAQKNRPEQLVSGFKYRLPRLRAQNFELNKWQ